MSEFAYSSYPIGLAVSTLEVLKFRNFYHKLKFRAQSGGRGKNPEQSILLRVLIIFSVILSPSVAQLASS
jgi:hypothetical protein